MPSARTADIARSTARTWRVGELMISRTCAALSGARALAGAASRAKPTTSAHARTADSAFIGTSVETVAPHPGVVRAAGLHSVNSPGLDGDWCREVWSCAVAGRAEQIRDERRGGRQAFGDEPGVDRQSGDFPQHAR